MATIIRGSDRRFRVVMQHADRIPLDLTSCTEIKASFIDENGEVVERKKTTGEIEIFGPPAQGVCDVILSKAFTATLKLNERQDWQILYTIAGKDVVYIFEADLNVKSQLGAF